MNSQHIVFPDGAVHPVNCYRSTTIRQGASFPVPSHFAKVADTIVLVGRAMSCMNIIMTKLAQPPK